MASKRLPSHPLAWLTLKRHTMLHVGGMKEPVLSSVAGGSVEWHSIEWKRVSDKVKYLQFSNSTLGQLPKINDNICPHEILYMDVQSYFVHDGPKLETTQMFINRPMNKQTVVHPCNGIILSNTKEGPDDT